MSEVSEAIDLVLSAASPSDLFDGDKDDPASARSAKRQYRKLAFLIHPDRATEDLDKSKVQSAFVKLGDLYQRWGQDDPVVKTVVQTFLRGSNGKYLLGDPIASGTISTVYDSEDYVIKIPRKPLSSKLILAEFENLSKIGDYMDYRQPEMKAFFPQIHDTITHRDKTGTRKINVFEKFPEGFVSLEQVKRAYPYGLDGRDYAWMHRRLLAVLATSHEAGISHGAVLPDNILIHPEKHGLILAGWSFSSSSNQEWAGKVKSFISMYPPEDKASLKSDVYMAHATMKYMLNAAETRQINFAKFCMQSSPNLRPDAPDLVGEYDRFIEKIYGGRRFRPFTLPKGN